MKDFSASEVRPGAILAGRYRVEGQIGAGGMGIVVSARHLQLGSRVAIKYLPTSWLGDPDAIERFKREAWAAAQIKSPHVVHVSDVANLPSGAPYLVMEYLEGEDLAHALARRVPMPVPEVTELLLQVCEAIAEAHALGIVHRDLKPSNIFVTRNVEGHRVAKVLDFGISKLTGQDFGPLGLTTTRTSLGSPTYMSPEQMHSAKDVDARTDIWALGVILYEMLAGRVPFSAPSFPELALQIATQPVLPLRAAGLEVPVGLERIVQRCLEKDRSKRFADVASLAIALTEFAPITASLHATRAERVLRDAGTSSQSVPIVPTIKGVGGEPGSRPHLREAAGGVRETPRRSGSERPGGQRSSDRVPHSSSPRAQNEAEPEETRSVRGSGRAGNRGSERSSRSSDKVLRAKHRERDDPSGRVVTGGARGSSRPSSGRPEQPAPKPATHAHGRSQARKRARPGVLLTAAVAVAVLLLAAAAITALVTSEPGVASRPGAETAKSAASETNLVRPAPAKQPTNSGE